MLQKHQNTSELYTRNLLDFVNQCHSDKKNTSAKEKNGKKHQYSQKPRLKAVLEAYQPKQLYQCLTYPLSC